MPRRLGRRATRRWRGLGGSCATPDDEGGNGARRAGVAARSPFGNARSPTNSAQAASRASSTFVQARRDSSRREGDHHPTDVDFQTVFVYRVFGVLHHPDTRSHTTVTRSTQTRLVTPSLVLLQFGALSLGAQAAPSRVASSDTLVAIVGATVIDGNGGPPLTDATIVVRGKRIAALGPRASVRFRKAPASSTPPANSSRPGSSTRTCICRCTTTANRWCATRTVSSTSSSRRHKRS